jgi:hypothetical protein
MKGGGGGGGGGGDGVARGLRDGKMVLGIGATVAYDDNT